MLLFFEVHEMILNKERIIEEKKDILEHLFEKIGHNDDVHENDSETLLQKDWYIENIPFVSIPDKLLENVYYFRWQNLLLSMSKKRSDGRWEFCESAPGEWYHKYIDCAQGAHVREARWIKNKKYLNDYLLSTPDKISYKEYLTDSVWQKYLLDGDKETLLSLYEKLKSRFHSLDTAFDKEAGLYFCTGTTEGQEAGVNCFDLIERDFCYTPSFTAATSSVESLTDNATEGDFWSCEGSGNSSDSIVISHNLDDFFITGIRAWFKNEAKCVKVYFDKDGEWTEAGNVSVSKPETFFGMTLITFDKECVKKIKVEFENDLSKGEYTSLYELVLTYNFEPWGCENFYKVISGDESYRINMNTFQAAAALTLSKMASLSGKGEESALYLEKYNSLKDNIIKKLWNNDISYFSEVLKGTGEKVVGRESNAYSMWSFLLAPDTEQFGKAWDFASSQRGFLSPFGITSLERINPHYMQPFIHACLWNGPVWPYTFSMILSGMANLLNSYSHHSVTKDIYFDLLSRYAHCHFDNHSETVLAVREDHHPENNHWIAQAKNYNHSTFVDNVLNGLLGIRPEEDGTVINPLVPDTWDYFCVTDVFVGHDSITLLWDKNGTKFGVGSGFFVYVNDKLVSRTQSIEKVIL